MRGKSMRHLFSKIGKGNKILSQIRGIFFLSVILPISILGVFAIFQTKNQMLEYYSSLIHADCARVQSILFDITTAAYTASDPVLSSEGCMKLFGSGCNTPEDDSNYALLESSLSGIYNYNASISSIHIYTDNPHIKNGPYISCVSDFTDCAWYQELPENVWESWGYISHKNRLGQDVYELCLIRRIAIVSGEYRAYLVICLDNNNIKNRIEQNVYKITAALDDGTIFYSSDTASTGWDMQFPDGYNGGFFRYNGITDTDGKKELTNILTFRTYKTNTLFYIKVSDSSAFSHINRIILIYLFIILFSTLVPLFIIFVFTRYFSQRIVTLKSAMHQASLGDYNIIETFRGDDELAETFKDLQTTIDLIRHKESLYYETKINEQKLINKQQQMEYNMLASQINPHFLYNTLETIRVQALTCDSQAVVDSINLLGKSMHYVLENTGTNSTTLQKELNYIKTYLAIQRLRFGDRVNAVFHIAPDCDPERIRILPLLLQPIVENSIIHGLEEIYENGYVTISIDVKNGFLRISISDNGIGMDEKTLETVRNNIRYHSPDSASSIGLYNINQRIKLFYGEKYTLRIDSVLEQGTTVTLLLPNTPVQS